MRRTIVPFIDTSPVAPALGAVVHSLQGQTMGTTWSVKLVAHPQLDVAAVQRAITQQLDLVIAQMSTWENDSNLSRYNRAAAHTWHPLPDAFMQVLSCALQVAEQSAGAYDPASGTLVNLWGFGPTGRYNEPGFAPPDQTAIAMALAQGRWQDIQLDHAQQRALQPGGIYLDFSAIAKGFAVDLVAQRLAALGIESFLVEIGGELRGHGIRPDGQPWWVALEQPPAAQALPQETLVALYGWSIATSGDYRRFFVDGATQRSHTIDPRTGIPVTHGLASVTVLHRDCMLADAWSTALGVMGPQQGLTCANHMGLAARFITREHDNTLRETLSTSLEELLQ